MSLDDVEMNDTTAQAPAKADKGKGRDPLATLALDVSTISMREL